MRVGAICSAGGSAFFSSVDLLIKTRRYTSNNFLLVTDRYCAAEEECEARNILHKRIIQPDKTAFSADAAQWFLKNDCDLVLLFFSRLVTAELFHKLATFNIHPSLLPAYKGFNALGRAKNDDAKFLGATLHLVSAIADSGRIISQVICPVSHAMTEADFSKFSYIQKIYLSLDAVDLMDRGALAVCPQSESILWNGDARTTWTSSPALLSTDLINLFAEFQKTQNLEVVLP